MKITLLTGRTFDFSDRLGFELRVFKSPRAKRITLRIDTKNHCPVLTLPKYCTQKKALQFVEENHDWIINTMARLPKQSGFANGDAVSFFGKQYIILHNAEWRGTRFEDDFLKVGGEPEFLHRRVTDFLKQEALKTLSKQTVATAKRLNCKVCGVAIKDTKSRWGSCSSLGNINYNWRISMAPLYVIDYLVCHEVAHLKHPNHSPAFWQTVQALCPNYEEGKHWLKIKGKDLYRYI
jgi:hypothetical protein